MTKEEITMTETGIHNVSKSTNLQDTKITAREGARYLTD